MSEVTRRISAGTRGRVDDLPDHRVGIAARRREAQETRPRSWPSELRLGTASRRTPARRARPSRGRTQRRGAPPRCGRPRARRDRPRSRGGCCRRSGTASAGRRARRSRRRSIGASSPIIRLKMLRRSLCVRWRNSFSISPASRKMPSQNVQRSISTLSSFSARRSCPHLGHFIQCCSFTLARCSAVSCSRRSASRFSRALRASSSSFRSCWRNHSSSRLRLARPTGTSALLGSLVGGLETMSTVAAEHVTIARSFRPHRDTPRVRPRGSGGRDDRSVPGQREHRASRRSHTSSSTCTATARPAR